MNDETQASNRNEKVLVLDEKVYRHYINPRLDIIHRTLFYKFSSKFKRNIYICHIVCDDFIKISNFKYLMEAQEESIEYFIRNKENIKNENSVFFTFFELKKGIRFTADVNMFNYSMESKKRLQEEYPQAVLGGIAVILDNTHFPRFKRALISIIKTFAERTSNVAVTTTISEAMIAIEDFVEKKFQ